MCDFECQCNVHKICKFHSLDNNGDTVRYDIAEKQLLQTRIDARNHGAEWSVGHVRKVCTFAGKVGHVGNAESVLQILVDQRAGLLASSV